MSGPALVCLAGLHAMTDDNRSARGNCLRCAAGKQRERRARTSGRAPLAALRPPAWMDDALCAQADPDAWFPEAGEWSTVRAAKRVCAACLVRPECLDYALERGERFGVWGGMSERERRDEARRRAEGRAA